MFKTVAVVAGFQNMAVVGKPIQQCSGHLLVDKHITPLRETEQELLSLAAKVPFDDRFNQRANMDDLSKPLMQAFCWRLVVR
jgi:hypothetical protein